MPETTTEQDALNLAERVRQDKKAHRLDADALERTRHKLVEQVAANVQLALENERLNQILRSFMRDRNGEE